MQNQKCVEMLVRNNAHVNEICTVTVNTETEMDVTPLILAYQLDCVSILELLVNAGTNIGKQIPNGMNALMLATDKNDTECVKLLLAHGATTNTQTRSLSPLMLTAINSNAQCMRRLLQHGSNPNIQDKNGNTALMMAARAKYVECLQLLIDKGANCCKRHLFVFHAYFP
ncbi:MAG: ankyrin repeat domain-containing protein, partial [Proteobacteria bacterium]|nr:ankyrin repeat domain-containing protein [Pseudomonadota bacterium]